jgi:phospholipid/cholesterol/gamma-HCH transport system substrate-binding protein
MASYRNIKVGVFMLIGLFVFGLVIFLIGEERQLFSSKNEYLVTFRDVEGLRRGSPVSMGGVTVGSVSGVAYSSDPKDPTIYVTLSIVASEATRIREDSVATITAKGLLGDKMISITVGSPEKKVLEPGQTIRSKEGGDLTEALTRLGGVAEQVERVVTNLETTTKSLADQELHRDIKEATNSLNNIFKSLDQGDGYAARILHDPKEADRVSQLISNLQRTSSEISHAAQGVNTIVTRIQQGPGFAHDVIYSKGPSRAIDQIGGAADEFRLTLKGIREGNGIAHSVVYGDEKSGELMANLNEMSADLKKIVADVRAGKGTVGALLVDPSVYEDVKLLLGNVGRNKALRALVRYSITQDEKSGTNVRDSSSTAAEPGGTLRSGGRAQAGGEQKLGEAR